VENSSRVWGAVIGMDLGDRSSQICRLDKETGEILEERRLSMTSASLQRYYSGLSSCRVILESGTHTLWVRRLLDAPWGVSEAATSPAPSQTSRGRAVALGIVLSAPETPHGASSTLGVQTESPLSRHPLRYLELTLVDDIDAEAALVGQHSGAALAALAIRFRLKFGVFSLFQFVCNGFAD